MEILNMPFVAPLEYPQFKGKVELVHKFSSISDFVQTMKSKNLNVPSGDFFGNENPKEALEQCLTGNLSSVPASESLMSELEAAINYTSSKFKVIDDIQGGVPNVAAYLAGSPLNMRRRQRQESDLGPLTICVDLSSQASVTNHQLEKRGIAILALVRVLAGKRPVTLWGGNFMSRGYYEAASVWTMLDTAPMDLARVAHFLTSINVMRGWHYSYEETVMGASLDYAWSDIVVERETAKRNLERHMGENVLFIPIALAKDRAINNPSEWLAKMIKTYSGPTN